MDYIQKYQERGKVIILIFLFLHYIYVFYFDICGIEIDTVSSDVK